MPFIVVNIDSEIMNKTFYKRRKIMLNAVKSAFGGKKILFLFLIVNCTLLIPSTRDCFSQWQPDVRLTNDPFASSTSYNNARCIAASGLIVHVVWHDGRNGVNNYEIYYKRSTDVGTTWGADTRLTNTNLSTSELASVSVSGSVVHVVWGDYRDGNSEIYYKRSTDEGISWGADLRLTNNSFDSQSPSLSVSGQVAHVVWYDNRDGNYEIYYKRSTDGGVSWETDTRLTNNSAQSWYPSVSVSGSTIHVVWYDGRDMNDEIYYKRSTDGGTSWGADTRLTNSTAVSQRPSIAVTGLVVHVVWWDNRDGNAEIYYKRSTDAGISWETDTRLTNNVAISYNPSVSVSASLVHVVWYDAREGNQEIYYKRSINGGINWEADSRLTTNGPGISYLPSVTVSGSTVCVLWTDDRDGNYEIYYKRDPTGNILGITNIGSEIPKEFSLGQNYPNPFNPKTKIHFALPKSSFAKIVVYDILGREVETLVNEQLNAGTYEADWSAAQFASGVYYYKLVAGDFVETKKMVLIK